MDMFLITKYTSETEVLMVKNPCRLQWKMSLAVFPHQSQGLEDL